MFYENTKHDVAMKYHPWNNVHWWGIIYEVDLIAVTSLVRILICASRECLSWQLWKEELSEYLIWRLRFQPLLSEERTLWGPDLWPTIDSVMEGKHQTSDALQLHRVASAHGGQRNGHPRVFFPVKDLLAARKQSIAQVTVC